MTFLADGKTTFGTEVVEALSALEEAGADVVGMNCTIGPQETLEVFRRSSRAVGVPVAVHAERRLPLGRLGADGLSRHARLLPRGRARLREGRRRDRRRLLRHDARPTSPRWRREVVGKARAAPSQRGRAARSSRRAGGPGRPSGARDVRPEAEARRPAALVVTVEIEPPKGTDTSAALDGARSSRSYGVDAVNVTDNPMARLRMSSIAVAHMIRHETGRRHRLPLLAARPERPRHPVGPPRRGRPRHQGAPRRRRRPAEDRRLPAGPARRRGRHARPPPDREGAERGRRHGGRRRSGPPRRSRSPAPRTPPRRDLDVEISKLSAKIEAGATFAQTQPVYDVAALDRFFARARGPARSRSSSASSRRRASSRRSTSRTRSPGMVVPEAILDADAPRGREGPRVRGGGGARDRRRARAAIAERARGIHLMPMARYDVVKRVLAALPRARSRARRLGRRA